MSDNPSYPHLVSLPSDRIVPMPELFRHASTLHGQAHVTRVMVHAIRLVEATGQRELGPRLWAAVFLHDIARQHDGVCHRHGADAAQRLREEQALQRRLADAGLTEVDHPAIEAAVTAHSARKEATRDHEYWPLIALLKDADALDRVRLGDLEPAVFTAHRGERDDPVCAGRVRRYRRSGGYRRDTLSAGVGALTSFA